MPSKTMLTTAINWSVAKCSCPSWNSSTDESALRSSLASLEDCGSSLHASFRHWTALVVIGVALELVFVIWEYVDGLHGFDRGVVHPPGRPNGLLFVLGLLGAGLVASGVAGELFVDAKIATVETCIRKGNDTLFLLLSGEVAKTNERAAEAELDTEKLREHVQWRHLNLQEMNDLSDHMKQFPRQKFDSMKHAMISQNPTQLCSKTCSLLLSASIRNIWH
jgi:hypothetical protein